VDTLGDTRSTQTFKLDIIEDVTR